MERAIGDLSGRELAERYAGESAWLNGERAIVGGRLLPAAIVGSLESPLRVEFSWHAVARVMENGGRFRA
jgi:hypothetical protein